MQMPAAIAVHPLLLEGEDRAPAYTVHLAGASPAPSAMFGMSVAEHAACFTILVCAHPPGPGWLQCLGPRTVWMASVGSPQQDLERLRQALLDPLQGPGLYSVDLADYWMALGQGRQIVVHSAAATCTREAIAKLYEGLGHPVALCLHLRMPMAAGMADVDQAVLAIESIAGVMINDPPLVLAVHCEDRSDVLVTLLAVYSSADLE